LSIEYYQANIIIPELIVYHSKYYTIQELDKMILERKEKLSQALGMIEKAIERNPQSGYIVDSLAWGLYKLGRYEEALLPMKKAYELLPFDPIINDHMGDILWNNGKRRSAKLYWKRSLSFNPEEEEVSKIKKKIKFGMD